MMINEDSAGASDPCPELIQKKNCGMTRFTLVSSEELEVEVCDKRNRNCSRIRLNELSGRKSRVSFKAGFLNSNIVAGLILTLSFGVPMVLTVLNGLWIGAFVLSLFAIPFGWMTLVKFRELRRTSYDVFVYEKNSGEAAFSVDFNIPDPDTRREFLEILDRFIKNASPILERSTGRVSLSEQLTQLEHLWKHGVLNDNEFALAKSRILEGASKEARAIGFAAAQ